MCGMREKEVRITTTFLGKREILFTETGNRRRKRFWKEDNMFTLKDVRDAHVKSKQVFERQWNVWIWTYDLG